MEVQRRSNVGNIIKLILGVILLLIFIPIGLQNVADTLYYNSAIKDREESIAAAKRYVGTQLPGKLPMENMNEYNDSNVFGNYKSRNLSSTALGFYKKTGIQLYFIDFQLGDEKYETEELLLAELKSRINELPGIDNAIVLYSYYTDYSYNSDYYYFGDDIISYGKNVMNYLQAEDMNMIDFYVKNFYEIYDYPDQFAKAWNKIGDNIINGYNTSELTNIEMLEWDIQYYTEDLTVARVILCISIAVVLISIVLIISGSIGIRAVNKVNHEMMEAEIEYKQARATREILEADIDYVNSKEDDTLLNKYSDRQ